MKRMRYANVLLGIMCCTYIMAHSPTHDHEQALKSLATSIHNGQCDRYALLVGNVQSNEHCIKRFIDILAWKNVRMHTSILYANDTNQMQEVINNITDYNGEKEKIVLTLCDLENVFSEAMNIHNRVIYNLKCMLEIINAKNNLFLLCTIRNTTDVYSYITDLFKTHIALSSVTVTDSIMRKECDDMHAKEQSKHNNTIILGGVKIYKDCYFD